MPCDRDKPKTFKDLAGLAGMKKATIDRLIAEDFDSVDAVKLMTTDDISEMEVSRGQTRLLEKWVQSMSEETTSPDTTSVLHEDDDPAATNSRSTDADLFLTSEAMDTWNTNEDISTQPSGKVLFIHDYVSRMSQDDHERAVCSQGGTQLILRSTRQKPAPENVSLAQWISANARIMSKLILDGDLKSSPEILDYLQYTMDFGDYAQVNELPSVMTYDHEYRRKQSTKKRKWGDDDIHLANFYLVRQRDAVRSRPPFNNATHPRPPRLLDNSGTEICRSFNGNGCHRSSCVYSHVCTVCKQSGHSRRYHRDQQPNIISNNVQPRGIST